MARFFSNQRGDTLLEVTFALAILSAILISSTQVAVRAIQLGQTAKERLTISLEAQKQLEGLRSFRDNHTWQEFIRDGDAASNFKGVLNAGVSDCMVDAPCFHTVVNTAGGITASVPAGGKTFASVPSSYMEIIAVPDDPITPTRVDVTVSYGFETIGGGVRQTGHIKTIFVDLGTHEAITVPPCVPRPKDVILTLDASQSMATVWDTMTREAKLKAVVNQYLDETVITPAGNHAAIVQFNQNATVLSNFTGDVVALKASMAGYSKFPATRYTPALNLDATLFNTIPPARTNVVQVVVFITDGLLVGDSAAAANAAANALKATGVRIYTIGIIEPTDPDFATASSILTSLAGNGGYFASADSEADLTAIISDIADSTNTGC